MRQTACLDINPIIVDGYASLFNCTTAVRASDSMMRLSSSTYGVYNTHMSKRTTKPTIRLMRPGTYDQRRLWSDCAVGRLIRVFVDHMCLLQSVYPKRASKNLCHTGHMYRLIFDGRTDLIVGFVKRWLIYIAVELKWLEHLWDHANIFLDMG